MPQQDEENALKEMIGDKFLKHETNGGGETTFDESIAGADLVGFYFSAHWCGPCRAFTPKLKAAYEKWKEAGNKIVIIFGTSDKMTTHSRAISRNTVLISHGHLQ